MELMFGVLKKKDGVIKLIEFNDNVIADLKIVIYDSRNKGSQYKVVESDQNTLYWSFIF